MEYNFNKDGDKLSVEVSGRVDTTTAPQLEEAILAELEGVKNLFLDFTNLEYISSAGLRLLLLLQKKMNAASGNFEVHNVNEFVMEVFEMTGFKDILTIS